VAPGVDDGTPPGGSDVEHPLGALSEHRHQVVALLVAGDRDRERDGFTGFPADCFQSDRPMGCEAEGENPRAETVRESSPLVGPPAGVHAAKRLIRSHECWPTFRASTTGATVVPKQRLITAAVCISRRSSSGDQP